MTWDEAINRAWAVTYREWLRRAERAATGVRCPAVN